MDDRAVCRTQGRAELIVGPSDHLHAKALDGINLVPARARPLDNNITERVLKKAILHRKNALYYRTLNGARAGDIYMSLIHTAELNGIAPFEYLVVQPNPDWFYPLCIAGARAAPPDDVGGAPGYAEFLSAIQDPKHEEHDSMLTWIGGAFDPEGFDLNAINRTLRLGSP